MDDLKLFKKDQNQLDPLLRLFILSAQILEWNTETWESC